MYRTIPEHAIICKTVGPWRLDEIPKPLLKRHNTQKGIWGKLEIISGSVLYMLCDTKEIFFLNKGDTRIILPQEYHCLKLLTSDDIKEELIVKIDFYKLKA